MPKRNTFSHEFKLEAIRQMEADDKKAADGFAEPEARIGYGYVPNRMDR